MKNIKKANYDDNLKQIIDKAKKISEIWAYASKWIVDYTFMFYRYGITHIYSEKEAIEVENGLKELFNM